MEKVTCIEVDGEGHKHGGSWRRSQSWMLMERVTCMEVNGEVHTHGG